MASLGTKVRQASLPWPIESDSERAPEGGDERRRHIKKANVTSLDVARRAGVSQSVVSRTFSRFAEDGLVEVRHRHVRILDVDKLKALLPQPA